MNTERVRNDVARSEICCFLARPRFSIQSYKTFSLVTDSFLSAQSSFLFQLSFLPSLTDSMDFTNENNPWAWQGDNYFLQMDPRLDISTSLWDDVSQSDPSLDISTSLWDDVSQSEDNLLCMFEQPTPVKACSDFDFCISDTEDFNKEECREFSQSKRRRMLQFSDEQIPSAFINSKDKVNSVIEGPASNNLQWTPNFSDGCTSASLVLDQSSGGWLANCFNDSEMHISSDEMEVSRVSDDQVDIAGVVSVDICNTPSEKGRKAFTPLGTRIFGDLCNTSSEQEAETMHKNFTRPRSRCTFRGRKSFLQSPTKLATSVAYPFTLIKPCAVQGDVTLKDINQRISTPPTSLKKKEDPSSSNLTSVFSGKPVVVKTKIHTEGGKGSITIMRTKG